MQSMRASTRKKRTFVAETALRLFRERGYEHVSVDDIIAATGTSKGTFYHYFKSKDELLGEIPRQQLELVQQWAERTRGAPPGEAEPRVMQLFAELGAMLEPIPRIVRSLHAISLDQPELRLLQERLRQATIDELSRLLGGRSQAVYLLAVYDGTIAAWMQDETIGLGPMLRKQLAMALTSLTHLNEAQQHERHWPIARKGAIRMRVAIIGGGLAGLTAAAYLSNETGIEGVLFERSPQLGGRAFTYEKAGFTLNYGAHAIYGLDRHTISSMEKDLGLAFGSKQVDKRKVMYEKHDQLTPAPLDFVNLVKTDILDTRGKMRFAAEITAIIANIHTLKNYPTLGDYLAESEADENVKELWEHRVCSKFFFTPEDAR